MTGTTSDSESWYNEFPSGPPDWRIIFTIYGLVQLAVLIIIVISKYVPPTDALVIWLSSGVLAAGFCLTCEDCEFTRPGRLASWVWAFQMIDLVVVWLLFWDST